MVLDEVCPKKQKTGEEQCNEIGYTVSKDDHTVSNSDEVDLGARPVHDGVGPNKLKPGRACVIGLVLRTTSWT